MFNRINKELLPIKAHYFLFNAGTGPLVPFLSIYARQLGFSSITVGLIYTILSISGMLAKPVFGAIADRFKFRKGLFLVSILLCAISFWILKYSPDLPVERKVHFSCDGTALFDTSPIDISGDSCLVSLYEKEDGLVNCQLKCPLTDDDWKEISNWKTNNSKPIVPSESFNFEAHVLKSLTQQFIDVVIFAIKNATLSDGQTYIPHCTRKVSSICDMECDDYRLNDLVTKPVISDNDVYGQYEFWIFLILMIFMWVTQAICVSLGDAICFEMLGDKPHQYGYQRLFGALGWGFITIITGIMVDALSRNSSKKDFTSAFYLAVSILIVDFLTSSQIKYKQQKHSPSILKDVKRVIGNIRVIVFLVWCISIGMCTGLMWNFFLWLVEDLANSQGCDAQNWLKTLEGILMGVQTLGGEMPFFFLSGWILKRIGHTHAMSLIPLVIGVRFILYSVISNPWYFLPIELLNGLTFGLFYACMASYASIVAPPGTEATMQGLVGSVFEGVGVSFGNIVAGFLYSKHHGPWTFRVFGVGSLIVCLLHAGVQFNIEKDSETRYSPPKDAQNMREDDQQELTAVFNYVD